MRNLSLWLSHIPLVNSWNKEHFVLNLSQLNPSIVFLFDLKETGFPLPFLSAPFEKIRFICHMVPFLSPWYGEELVESPLILFRKFPVLLRSLLYPPSPSPSG
jgi:hypothetical protein